MIFIVKDCNTGQIHEVIKFLASTDGKQCIWSLSWPGRHIIGEDCEWSTVTEIDWNRIKIVRENPDKSINQLTKLVNVSYSSVFRLIEEYRLPFQREREVRKPREKTREGKYFNADVRESWMV